MARPPIPKNLSVTKPSPSTIIVSWDAVEGADQYDIFRNEEYFTSVFKTTTYIDKKLSDANVMAYQVTAINNSKTGDDRIGNRSPAVSVNITNVEMDDTVETKSIQAAPPPPPVKVTDPMAGPNLIDNIDWKLIWNDEFDGAVLNTTKWRIEKLLEDEFGNRSQSANHVVNTYGHDTEGNLNPSKYPLGKRHAMWYDKYHDKTIKMGDGRLTMGAYASIDRDPTIKKPHHPYTNPRNNKTADFTKKLYTGWIDTFALTYSNEAKGHVPNPHAPNFYYRYGFIEFGVNFSRMKTEGLRLSGWLLPAVDPANPNVALNGTVYNSAASDGLEVDVWEYEYSPTSKQLLLCKNIGAGAAKPQAVDCSKFGIDLTVGDHTIAVKWTPDAMIWYVDGIEVFADRGENAIPQIAQAVYITREGNSSVGGGNNRPKQIEPHRQSDHGLWGWNVGTESPEKINADEAYINYVRVYQDPNQAGNWVAPKWNNLEGVETASVTKIKESVAPKATVDELVIPIPDAQPVLIPVVLNEPEEEPEIDASAPVKGEILVDDYIADDVDDVDEDFVLNSVSTTSDQLTNIQRTLEAILRKIQ